MSDNNNNNNDEYEKVCYVCRRTESKAGKMISMPGGLYVCPDCMQDVYKRQLECNGSTLCGLCADCKKTE